MKLVHSHGFGASAATALLSLTASLAPAQDELRNSRIHDEANAALHVTDSSVVVLDFDRTPGLPLTVEIPLEGDMVLIDLSPYSVRADGYRLIEQRADGTYHDAKPGPINTLRGGIRSVPDSVVAGGIMPDGLYATIVMPDGHRYWIQPFAGLVPDAAPGAHAIYAGDDILSEGHRCGLDDQIGVNTIDIQSDVGGLRGANRFIAELACDADFEYYSRYGSIATVEARINLVINTMNIQFERDVDIEHAITAVVVRLAEPDPYTTTDDNVLWTQFRDHWNAHHNAITRDVAHLFTGKNLDGTVIGNAGALGTICTSNAYSLVQSDFNNNFGAATDLSAHEFGHSWLASHCECANPAFTMNPNATGINRFGGPPGLNGVTDIVAITAHRNSRLIVPFACLDISNGGTVPGNDTCADAVPLSTGRTAFGNAGAANNGPAACAAMGADLWYTFNSPCNASVTIDTCDSNFDTVLAVYTGGCTPSTGQQIACNDDTSGCGLSAIRGSRVTFMASANTTYRIRVGGFNSATGSGVLAVTADACPPPANDTCAGAIVVTNGVFPFSTSSATTDGFLDCNAFGFSQFNRDIWYEFRPPCGGTFRVSTCGSSFDTKIAVYSNCPSGPDVDADACNDDNGPLCPGSAASLLFSSPPGNNWFIRVGGFGSAHGSGTLRLESVDCPIPANDDCAEAINLNEGITNAQFDITGASNDGSSSCASLQTSRDVWFTYTAIMAGTLNVNTCGSDFLLDTVLSAHSNCPRDGGVQLRCSDNASCPGNVGVDGDSAISVPLAAGQTVRIRVGVAGTQVANRQFVLSTSFTPHNDLCANALPLPPCEYEGVAELHGATSDNAAGGCAAAGANRDVWYSFVAPTPGTLTVSTCGTNDRDGTDTGTDTVLDVFSECPPNGMLIACNDDSTACGNDSGGHRDSRVSLPLTAGQSVRIRLTHFGSAIVQRRVLVQSSFTPNNDTCAGATPVSDGAYPFCTTGANASLQACGSLSPDLFYLYTAPCTGLASISLCGSSYDTVLAVYDNACGIRLPTCNDDDGPLCDGFNSSLQVPVQAGSVYTIQISGYNGASGEGTLLISCPPDCPCDWNHMDGLDSQDFFDFLTDFFEGNADFNGADGTDSQDYFDFIECFLSACP